MVKLFDKEQSYKIRLEVNKDEVLKDIKEIKKETGSIIKDAEYNINKIRLKRKDILIVKYDMYLKDSDKNKIEKTLKNKLHRKVIVLDKSVRQIEAVER